MGLHPWEFWEYTFEDYILKRKGFFDNRDVTSRAKLRAEFNHYRLVAYYTILPHLKKSAQGKPWTELIPDIYDESTRQEDFGKWMEEMRAKGKKRTEKLKNLGKRA